MLFVKGLVRDHVYALAAPFTLHEVRKAARGEYIREQARVQLDDDVFIPLRKAFFYGDLYAEGEVGIGQHRTRALAVRASLRQNGDVVALHLFAGEGDHAEVGHGVHAALGAVFPQAVFQFGDDGGAVLRALHVDKVDDDDAADVAQAHLPRDLAGGEQIGGEYRVFQPGIAGEFARVHVDRGERLRTVEYKIGAARERYAGTDEPVDLLFQPEVLEHFARSPVRDEFALPAGAAQRRRDAAVCGFVADIDIGDARQVEIAQQAHMHVGIAVDEVAHRRAFVRFERGGVQPAQIPRLRTQLCKGHVQRVGAHDEPAALRSKFPRRAQKLRALLFARDLAGDGTEIGGGQEDEVLPHKREAHGQPRALRADGRFCDLHHHFVARLYVERAVCGRDVCLGGDIPRIEIAVLLLPEGDECRLHTVEHVDDPALVNVAGDLARTVGVKVKFDKVTALGDRRKAVFAEVVKKHILLHISRIVPRASGRPYKIVRKRKRFSRRFLYFTTKKAALQ